VNVELTQAKSVYAAPVLAPPQHPALAALQRVARSPNGLFGSTILLFFVILALFSSVLAPYDPVELHLQDQLKPPSAQYWLGTDELGRDILSRLIHGASISLQAGLVAVLVAALVGLATGLAAGYWGGWIDSVIMRGWDTLLAFPAIFLAIGIVSVLGPGRLNAVLAVAIINMPTFARLIRASTLAVKNKEFVLAAHALGASDRRIMMGAILPNCIAPFMVQAAIAVPTAILIEATLAFLGLGTQPPAPSWGNMLQAAQAYLYQAPTYGLFPGVAITLVVIGMNFLADALQDAIDPRRARVGGRAGA
jgi:peptide/nickel transport system permease protein